MTDEDYDSYMIQRGLDCILDNALYLGNLESAMHRGLLAKYGITHIVNLACTKPVYPDLEYLCINVGDDPHEPLHRAFDGAFSFIDAALAGNGKVLVHCQAGVSRSATIVIGYLMHHHKMTLDDAHMHTKQRRPCVYPNAGFRQQLIALHRKIHGDDAPVSVYSTAPPLFKTDPHSLVSRAINGYLFDATYRDDAHLTADPSEAVAHLAASGLLRAELISAIVSAVVVRMMMTDSTFLAVAKLISAMRNAELVSLDDVLTALTSLVSLDSYDDLKFDMPSIDENLKSLFEGLLAAGTLTREAVFNIVSAGEHLAQVRELLCY